MAQDELVGNMDTLYMIELFKQQQVIPGIDEEALLTCIKMAGEIFI